ncbi:MAG: PhoH family protein [Alphaproteobacteria bacterium]
MSRRPRTANAAREPAPLYMTFDDNVLLPALFGEHDRNLARIEQELGVALVSRGNQIAISGPSWSTQAAKVVLDGLYGRLARGLEVGAAEVDTALRFALEGGGAAGDWEQDLVIQTQKRTIEPRSLMQAAYVRALCDYELVLALGPAGTGKTYLAVAMAVSMLVAGKVDRIILSRPAVEAGERLGFLPGDVREKVDPYLRPLYDALHDMMPGDKVRRHFESGDIEVAPLAFMRGRTLSNAYIILDEAQNTSTVQMKMFLTRFGENSRMVVTGDLSQIDLPPGTASGLRDALETVGGVDGVTVISFSDADVVRHGLVTRIVRAYDAKTRNGTRKPGNAGEPA